MVASPRVLGQLHRLWSARTSPAVWAPPRSGCYLVLEHRHDLSAVVLPMTHAPFVLAIVFLSVVARCCPTLRSTGRRRCCLVARTAALINFDRCVRARRGAPPARLFDLAALLPGCHPCRHWACSAAALAVLDTAESAGTAVPCRGMARALPHFLQSSMLLHNLSRNFLQQEANQLPCVASHLLHRTTAITHPAASPTHQRPHRLFHIFAGFPQRPDACADGGSGRAGARPQRADP